MKAVMVSNFGGPETLLWKETEIPQPKPHEVLIKVKAAAINPVDWKVREGMLKDLMQLPFVLGCDVAGIVQEVGSGVDNFKEGDEVFAMLDLTKGGGYAEFVTTEAEFVALKPKRLNFEEAASVPLASLTAWQAMFDEAQLKAKQKVLIHAASGGVGSFAVQIAKAHDLYVAATTSTKNIKLIKSLGADLVIDYSQEDFTTLCQNYDMVLDPLGGEVQSRSLKCLKKGGTLVTIVNLTCQEAAKKVGVTALHTLVRPDGDRLAQIANLIDAGKIKPLIAQILTSSEIQAAHQLSQSGRAQGKIVIKMQLN
ncbi:MAG: NADP-dependent oxidoreductase [Proteobacteria bacterium]|nr:NADP-dependent oxidoreductase [Pseudomonadota bacterium]